MKKGKVQNMTDEIIRKIKIYEKMEFEKVFGKEEEIECYCDFEFEEVSGENHEETIVFKIDVLKLKVYLDNWLDDQFTLDLEELKIVFLKMQGIQKILDKIKVGGLV